MSREQIRELIGAHEADGYAKSKGLDPYDVVYAGSKLQPPKPISQMTVAEVLDWQDRSVAAGSASSAAGRYQFIRKTLRAMVGAGVVAPDALFDADTQNRLADAKLDQRGYTRFATGAISAEQFGNNLAMEWASLPVVAGPKAGRSYYDGTAGNASGTTPAAVLSVLSAARSAVDAAMSSPPAAASPQEGGAPEVAPGFRGAIPQQAPFAAPGSFGERVADAFHESGIVRAIDRRFSASTADVPGFEPLAPENLTPEALPYWRELRHARNPEEFDFVLWRAKADDARSERQLFAQGFMPELIGGFFQPETLASMVFVPGSLGIGFVQGAARVGGANLAFETGAEVLRRRETGNVSAAESAFRIGGASVFGGLLGGVAGAIGAKTARDLGRRMSEDLAASGGIGRITTSLQTGDETLAVRSVRGLPNDAPPVAHSSGVWLNRESGQLLVDDAVVSRSFAAKPWTARGLPEDAFANANEWREYLIRLTAAREELGVGRVNGPSDRADVFTGEAVDAQAARQADLEDQAQARALQGFEAWRKSNRVELENRMARGVRKMVSTPYKRVHERAGSAETVDLVDALIADAGFPTAAAAAGRDVAPSIAIAGRLHLRPALEVKRAEDEAYAAYLGYPNTTVAGVSIPKAIRRKRANGEPAMKLAEFRRRASHAIITGEKDTVRYGDAGLQEIDDLAEAGRRFFKAFEDEANAVRAFGPTNRKEFNQAIGIVTAKADLLRDKVLPKVRKSGEPAQIQAVLDNIARLENRARVYERMRDAEPSRVSDTDYFTRIYVHQNFRRYPKTVRALLRKHFLENPWTTVWDDDVKGFIRVQTDPATVDQRVEAAIAKILGESEPLEDLADAGSRANGPAWLRSRQIELPNSAFVNVRLHPDEGSGVVDLIETDLPHIAAIYSQRMGPYLEFARRFGDWTEDLSPAEGFAKAVDAAREAERKAFKGKPEDFADHWAPIERDLVTARDQALNRLVEDPSRWDNRTASALRDGAHLAFMGMSGFASIPDAGKIVMAHGLENTAGTAFMGLDKTLRTAFDGLEHEAEQAAALADMALGTTTRRVAEVGTEPVNQTAFERVLKGGVNLFYIANGLGPLTHGLNKLAGAQAAHRFIDDALAVAAGKGTAEQVERLGQHFIDAKMARRIARMRDEGHIQKHEAAKVWLANSDAWTDKGAVRAYRAAILANVQNTVLVASHADKPAVFNGVLHFRNNPMLNKLAPRMGWRRVGGYWRVQSGLIGLPFQFWNFGVAAMNKITVPLLERPSAQALGGAVMMAGLGYMVASLRTPSWAWDKMSTVDQLVRTIDQAGLAGMMIEFAHTGQNVVGATTGVNPLPINYRLGDKPPTPAEALWGLLGAGPAVGRNLTLGAAEGLGGEGWNRFSWGLPGRNWPITSSFYAGLVDKADESFKLGPPRL